MIGFKKIDRDHVAIALIASIWLSIILFYTKGGLLVGGDYPGYYDAYAAIRTGGADGVIYGISLLLSSGNIYAGFYVRDFIGIFLNLMALSYFLVTLFGKWKGNIVPTLVAAVLYSFSMFALFDTFKTVIDLANISNGGLILFLAQIVRLYRHMNQSQAFKKSDSILTGIAIAASSAFPPNSFRILITEAIIAISILALSLIKPKVDKASQKKRVFRDFFSPLYISAAIAVTLMLYWEIPFFSSFEKNIRTALDTFSAKQYATLSSPASLINVFRILNAWQFQTVYCPYWSSYFQNPLMTVFSFLWPIASLGLSIVLADGKDRSKVLSLVIASLLVMSWDTGANPPLGWVNKFVVSQIPLISGLFPTSFLSTTILPIFFITLSTYAVVRILELTWSPRIGKKNVRQHFVVAAIVLLIVIALLIPAKPFFTGEALGQYFNENVKGIWIPEDYNKVRNILSSSGLLNDTAVLWPSIGTYVQTSWNYQGSNYFYNAFFSPFNIITPDYIGEYAFYNPELAAEYHDLTRLPLKQGFSIDITGDLETSKLRVNGTKYQLSNDKITLYLNDNSTIDVVMPFSASFNATNYQFLTLQALIEPKAAVEELLTSGKLWIGIGSSDGFVGWYKVGLSSSSSYSIYDNGSLAIPMLIDFPDKPWASSKYDPSRITSFDVRLFTQGMTDLNHTSLTITALSTEASLAEIDQSIFDTWKHYGVKYVIIDNSFVEGATMLEPYLLASHLLLDKGMLTNVFSGKYIQLYAVDY